jgi:hypothetical protein
MFPSRRAGQASFCIISAIRRIASRGSTSSTWDATVQPWPNGSTIYLDLGMSDRPARARETRPLGGLEHLGIELQRLHTLAHDQRGCDPPVPIRDRVHR